MAGTQGMVGVAKLECDRTVKTELQQAVSPWFAQLFEHQRRSLLAWPTANRVACANGQSLTQWGWLADARCAASAGSPVPKLHRFQYSNRLL
ncbi:MAG: hypothetical protein F6K56_42195 [Moorea sp. SIO3G5]|nr:hypothetical protein [Moorena sp. SIO3G5]